MPSGLPGYHAIEWASDLRGVTTPSQPIRGLISGVHRETKGMERGQAVWDRIVTPPPPPSTPRPASRYLPSSRLAWVSIHGIFGRRRVVCRQMVALVVGVKAGWSHLPTVEEEA